MKQEIQLSIAEQINRAAIQLSDLIINRLQSISFNSPLAIIHLDYRYILEDK